MGEIVSFAGRTPSAASELHRTPLNPQTPYADERAMASSNPKSGWRWFYLVTQVFVVLWALDLVRGAMSGSGSGTAVAAINLIVWGPLCAWARQRTTAATKDPSSTGGVAAP